MAKDLSNYTPDELADLQVKLKAAQDEHRARGLRAASKERRDRAKASVRKPEPRKPGARGGVSLRPSDKPDEALAQMKRSFGDQWLDDQANPAVLLVQCEAQHCARLNVYHEGKWTSRRLGVDAVVAIVQLTDGTQETRKFERGILNDGWRRS